jgi:hypothetical protein
MLRPPSRALPTSPAADEVWYFAFGSNMSSATLTGRRRVVPRRSVPAMLPQYGLSFGMLGAPYSEPGFAVLQPLLGPEQRQRQKSQAWWPVLETERRMLQQQRQRERPAGAPPRPSPPPAAHGVLHLLSRDDWRRVLASEGVADLGGGSEKHSMSLGYRPARVRCSAYDPCARRGGPPPPAPSREGDSTPQPTPLSFLPQIDAVTLLGSSGGGGGAGGGAGQHGRERRPLPSRRYLTLLREGAREHGLSPEYRAWLDALACYDPSPEAMGARVAGAVAAAGVAAAAAPVAVAAAVLSGGGGGGGGYLLMAQRAAWLAHDWALAPFFGNGGAVAAFVDEAEEEEEEEEGGGVVGGRASAAAREAGDTAAERRTNWDDERR